MNYTTLALIGFGIAGILLHNLVEIGKLNRQSAGNFKILPYIKLEWPSLLISLIVVTVASYLKSEISQLEAAGKWLGVGFVAVGYMAQSVLIAAMGKASKIIGNDPQ